MVKHTTGYKVHAGCTTDPHTCFASVQGEGNYVAVLSLKPEGKPCVAKVQASGVNERVCAP